MTSPTVDKSNAGKARTLANAATRFAAMKPADVAAATADAEGWKPEAGSELQGLVVAIKSGISEYKEKAGRNPHYPIVFVLPNDSEQIVSVHCFHTVLENEMRAQRPQPGEDIYIKCIGPAENAKRGESPAMRYAVYVERETGVSDPWERMQ